MATFLTINIGMGLFYGFSISVDKYIALLIVAAMFHFVSILAMVVLAFANPGTIPKIYGTYEHKDFKKIPISEDYLDGSIG